jgi:phage terminase large subunit GpA-like protein
MSTVQELVAELKRQARDAELDVKMFPDGHFLVIGGVVNVHWWPYSRRQTAYADRAKKGRNYATPKMVVKMAMGQLK